MTILDKYLLPTYQAPDATSAAAPSEEPPAITPPEPEATPEPEAPKIAQTVPVHVVTGLRAKTRELEERLARSERAEQEARALAERLAQNNPEPAPMVQPRQEPEGDVDRRAAEMVFARDALSLDEAGLRAYGREEWAGAVNLLGALGINNADFVGSIIDVDRARSQDIIMAIAKDPERAATFGSMTPARRIAEITRISMEMTNKATAEAPVVPAKTPPKTVSRAPAPAPAIAPSASKVKNWRNDDASDAEFDEGFKEMMAKRSARR